LSQKKNKKQKKVVKLNLHYPAVGQ